MLGDLLRRGWAVGALGVTAVGLLGLCWSAPAAADPVDGCTGVPEGTPQPDWCLDQSTGGGGSPDNGSNGGSPGRGASGATTCGWVTVPAEIVPAASSTRPAIFTNGRPPEGMDVVWQGWCYNSGGLAIDFRGPFRWLPVGAPAPLTPAEVAQGAYEAIQGRMPDPVVVTNPPVGADATIGVPVFVTVTNWQAELVEVRDLLGSTVTVRAAPALVVTSGEPGTPSRSCPGPGRAYDPAGGDLWEQAAAPDACTLTYGQRTGVDGRPQAWPSTVVVRWSISWSATSGESGVFPVVERTVSVPRGVGEVPTVVVGRQG